MQTKISFTIYLSFIVLLSSCLNSGKDNLRKGEKNWIRVNDNMAATYYKDSSLFSLGTIPDGGVCKFYPNGMIKSVFSLKAGKVVTDIVHFDDTGRVQEIIGYDGQIESQSIHFKSYGIVEASPHLSVISRAQTFVTLDPDKDTIVLGATYSAKIMVNFPLKGHIPMIYKAHGKVGNAYLLASGTEATFTEIPADTGEHKYVISVWQVKNFKKNGDDSIASDAVINALARYYVKSKK